MKRFLQFGVGLILPFFNPCFSQQILKDINATPASLIDTPNNSSQRCFTCADQVFFLAKDSLGNELWRTDGTLEGTRRVTDLNPGAGDGVYPYEPVLCVNGTAYFRGNFALWKTDGTASGTTRVANNNPGPAGLHPFNGNIYYTSRDNELWSTTGDLGSEELIKTIDYDGLHVNFTGFAAGSSSLFFTIVLFNDSGVQRSELWRTDGTPAGTAMIKSFEFLNHYLNRLVAIGDRVFFRGIDADHGAEPWVSDGTEGGTLIVSDLKAGAESSEYFVNRVYNERLIFSLDGDTWISDGTAFGTEVLISDVYSFGSAVSNNSLYLLGSEYGSWNTVLVKTDGTPGVSEKLDTLGTGSLFLETLPIVNNKFVFPFVAPETGIEIGVSDGQPNGAKLLKDINAGPMESSPRSYATLGDQLIFIADDGVHGFELWATDGTSAATQLVKDVRTGTESANIGNMHLLNGKLYFLAGTNTFFRDLWSSDGTATGTEMVHEFTSPHVFGSTEGHLIIMDGSKFWKSDGTSAGTSVMWDYSGLFNGGGYNSNRGIAAGNNLYFQFAAGDQPLDVWRANTVTNEVVRVENTDAAVHHTFNMFKGAALGEELVFAANDAIHGEEVWITKDGGSKKELLKDIRPGSVNAQLSSFYSAGDKVFFTADDGVQGGELWVTDGTSVGTVMVKDIAPGATSALSGQDFTVLNNKVIFSAHGPEGEEPWISDGTLEGTHIVKDLHGESSFPKNFVTFEDRVYFFASVDQSGVGLYVTDGTSEGTKFVASGDGLYTDKMALAGGAMYLYSNKKIWRTHVASGATEEVSDVEVFSNLYAVNNHICFEAQNSQLGRELFVIEVVKFNQTIQFAAIASKTLGEGSFQLDVVSSSGLPVTFTSGDSNISLTGMQVELLDAGEVTITATQDGDDNFNPATPVSQTFCVNPPKPVISVDMVGDAAWLTSSSVHNNAWYRNAELLAESSQALLVEDAATYTLKVSVEGCSSEPSEAAMIYTDVNDLSAALKIYPNPVVEVLQVRLPQTNIERRFVITDLTGKVIVDRAGSKAEEAFNVSGLAHGLYVIQIISGQKKTIQLFVKD